MWDAPAYPLQFLTEDAFPHEHVWITEIITPATCSTAGLERTWCECGEATESEIAPTGEHIWNIEVITPATCGNAGWGLYSCEGCAMTMEAEIAPTGEHSWITETTVSPTCGNAGFVKTRCNECGLITEVTILPTGDHNFVNDVCSVCGRVANCETEHSYEVDLLNNPQRFNATWGICTICGYVDDYHEHSIKDGKCVYCEYVFETFEVPSFFDNDYDGMGDVFYFSAALPEEFTGEDVIWIDAVNNAFPDGNHMEYDEIRVGSGTLPYPHVYCYDRSNNALVYTINVEKTGIYNVAVHYRIKDQKTRGAKFVVNEGTENEQVINHTFAWPTADEVYELRNNDFLIGAYMTGLSFYLQEGTNTITIRVADGIEKPQHFRGLYLVKG